MLAARVSHLRVREGHGHHRVTFVELFFDLVFVFAVTQLSHGLLHHLTLLGALQTAILLVAVWWSWIDTAWITIPIMGMTMGEIFQLKELADDCEADKVYEFLFVAPAIPITGAVGSPVNPLAIK